MIASLAACALVLGQVQIDQPQRLRTILPSGGVILVERVPRSANVSLQLFAGTRGIEADRGQRHLLEHLVARGSKQDLDSRLEAEGAFLRPQTLRDAMVFEVLLPPGKLKLGLSALRDIVRARVFSKERIAKEIRIHSRLKGRINGHWRGLRFSRGYRGRPGRGR